MLPLLISAAVVLSTIASPPAGHGAISWEACHGVTFSLPSSWTAEEDETTDGCNVHLYPKSWKKTVQRAKVVLLDHVFWLIITPRPSTKVALSRQFEVADDHWVLAPGTIDSQVLPLLRRNGWVGVAFELRGGNRTYKRTYNGGGNAGVVFYHGAIVGTETVTAEILESEPYYYPEIFDVLLNTLRFPKSFVGLRLTPRCSGLACARR